MMEKDIFLGYVSWGSGTTAIKYKVSPLDTINAKVQSYGLLKIEYQIDIVVSGS